MPKNKKLKLYGTYLKKLGHYKRYINILKEKKKNNNIRIIKEYFKGNIFISINDFHNGNYKLFNNLNELHEYFEVEPSARKPISEAKQEGYKIFLKKLY